MKIAFVSPPYDVSNAMAGVGLRIWELAQVLSQKFEVAIVTPQASDLSFPGITFVPAEEGRWQRAIAESQAAFFYDLPDTRMLLYAHRLNKQIVCENAPPLEHLEYGGIRGAEGPDEAYQEVVDAFKLQVLLGDHFIVRSDVERSGMIASFALLGRLNYANYNVSATLDHLMSLVPVAFNRFSDAASSSGEEVPAVDYVWNGGVWDFYSPQTVAAATRMLLTQHTPATVRFMYMPPEDQEIAEAGLLTEAIEAFKLGDLIQIHNERIPHVARDGFVRNSRAILCVGKPGIENMTCHRFRLRDVFLYEKPIIVDRHGASGDVVDRLGVGLTVDSQDAQELAGAMHRLKTDDDTYASFKRRIRETRHLFTYEHNVESLVRFLERGQRAPDVGTVQHDDRVSALLSRRPDLEQTPSEPF